MFSAIRKAVLSALIGIGTLAAVSVTAQADGVYLNFGRQGDPRVGVYGGDRDRGFRHYRRHSDHDRGWERNHNRGRDRDRGRDHNPDRDYDRQRDRDHERYRDRD